MTARRHALVAVLAGALLAGCGPTRHLDLNLRAVSITVPRLITPAVTLVPAAPPATAPLPPAPAPEAQLPLLPTTEPSTDVTLPSAPACPKAGTFAVPGEPASLVVSSPPAPATYTQRVSGSYATTAGNGVLGGDVTQTVTALPRAVSSVGQVIDTWSVARTYLAQRRTSVEVFRLLHPSSASTAVSPGIYLVGLAWNDPVRGKVSFQAGGNGIWVLPDPVELAQRVEGVAAAQSSSIDTDAGSTTTLSIVRNVTGKKRVDACGSLIDAYTVEMTGVLTTPDWQRQVAWTMQLATSFGGIDVQDDLTLSDAGGGFRWSQTQTSTSVPKAVAS